MTSGRAQAAQGAAGASPTKVGWRVNEWCFDVGLSRASFYNLLKAGKVEIVKSGAATIVTTAPRDFLASLRREAA